MPLGRSVCSMGLPVDFYWHACEDDRHIDAAADVLMAAVDGPSRVWSPYAKIMARREFVKRLETAARGELVPVDHVKAIDEGSRQQIDLFEIRWQGIPVTEINNGRQEHKTVLARLLHAEPPSLPDAAVGLHAHEKVFFDDSKTTRDAQDQEISTAINMYRVIERNGWNFTPSP